MNAICAGRSLAVLTIAVLAACAPPTEQARNSRPKYAKGVTTLTDEHEFFRKHEAPDFWRLMPHYASQPNDSACSLAATAMIVNAACGSPKLASDVELATPQGVLAKVGDDAWDKATKEGGEGVALAQFGTLLERSLAAYRVAGAKCTVKHVTDAGQDARRRLHETLAANENSAGDFIVANILQGELTGDPEGAVGHMVVIGAYDAPRERVLILDPDRRWYEPYWVPLDALLAGIATRDAASGKNRGYVRVVLDKKGE